MVLVSLGIPFGAIFLLFFDVDGRGKEFVLGGRDGGRGDGGFGVGTIKCHDIL